MPEVSNKETETLQTEGQLSLRTSRASKEEAIKPAAYDFEKMIEEAMRKHGETPAVQPPPVGGMTPDRKVEAPAAAKKIKKVDPKKAALLAKRKSYDPRAAARQSKKRANSAMDEVPKELNNSVTPSKPMESEYD